MRTSFDSWLGLNTRIIQAPLGGFASVELAAAVSNAGGLGSLALAWTEPTVAAQMVIDLRRETRYPFFVNFVLSFQPSALTAALEAGAPMVSFSWGLPGPLVKLVKSFGAKVLVQVGTEKGAQRALDEGCDAIICQGIEAGGHVQSSTPLRELLPQVVAISAGAPVIAAGGLMDGPDIAEVLSLGADAAMLGTRFVASTECQAHADYKRALIAAERGDTCLTGCFDGGWPYAPSGVLRNSTLLSWETDGCPPVGKRPGENDVIATTKSGSIIRRYDCAAPTVDMEGDVLACCLYAGAGAYKIRDIRPAGSLLGDLWKSAQAELNRLDSQAIART
jgi:nitronate monooxygenase